MQRYARDRGENFDREGNHEEHYGEEEYKSNDCGDYVSPVGVEGYYGEQGYDCEEIKL